jgi:8-amino-7-oxononanoate synthase
MLSTYLPERPAMGYRRECGPGLDFTSALYLGLDHSSRRLPAWKRLTLGKPAALHRVPRSGEVERKLAALIGCERALLVTSTLHLFFDLFSILARRKISILLDRGSYPIVRWGVERAACSSTQVRGFRHYDAEALRGILESPDETTPVIVADGYCPRCGKAAPVEEYLALARSRGGFVVLDDSQSLGIFGDPSFGAPYGTGGGGSLRRAGLRGDDGVLIGSSLAKAFGAPLAVLAGDARLVDEFERRSATRVHCSPPSAATVAAAARALMINRSFGDRLRLKLAHNVSRFRRGLREMGLVGINGLFPVQSLRLPARIKAETLHRKLSLAGVAAVLHREGREGNAQISFVLTARHTFKEIDCALARLAEELSQALKPEVRPFMDYRSVGHQGFI